MLLKFKRIFLNLKKVVSVVLFYLFMFSLVGESLANTINANTDTIENNDLDLNDSIKANTTYDISNNAVYTLNG